MTMLNEDEAYEQRREALSNAAKLAIHSLQTHDPQRLYDAACSIAKGGTLGLKLFVGRLCPESYQAIEPRVGEVRALAATHDEHGS